MVMAAATQAPEEAVPDSDGRVASRVGRGDGRCRQVGRRRGVVEAHQIVSPTKEAKLKWLTGLLGSALHKGAAENCRNFIRRVRRPSVHVRAQRHRQVASTRGDGRASILDATQRLPEASLRRPRGSRMTPTPPPCPRAGSSATMRKNKFQKQGTASTRKPSSISIVCGTVSTRAPPRATFDAFGGRGVLRAGSRHRQGKGSRGSRVRSAAWSAAFAPASRVFSPSLWSPRRSSSARRTSSRFQSRCSRAMAPRATPSPRCWNWRADDVETEMALFVADKLRRRTRGTSTGSNRRCARGTRTPPRDAAQARAGRPCQPRWLVAEYAFLRFSWRGSAAYRRGGPGADHPSHPSFVARGPTEAAKYSSVRAAARCASRAVMKRFSRTRRPRLCDPAKLALAAKPADAGDAASGARSSRRPRRRIARTDPAPPGRSPRRTGTSHHDAEKAQTAVNERCSSIAIRFDARKRVTRRTSADARTRI